MIDVTGQSQGLNLQLTVRLNLIDEVAGIGKQELRIDVTEIAGFWSLHRALATWVSMISGANTSAV